MGLATKTRYCSIFAVALMIAAAMAGCGGGAISSTSNPPPPATRLLIVADDLNSRVLIYDAPFSTGESASVVLGQSDFVSNNMSATATTMDFPIAVAADASGNLYVTDWNNCRVLQFIPPFTTGMAASAVLGQADFTSRTCLNGTATATGLSVYPSGLTIDSNGDLWVADTNSSRILKYPHPFTTGEAAVVALGEPDLTTVGPVPGTGCSQLAGRPSANTLCFPGGLAFDSSGNLWVADNGDNRVVMYPQANLVTGASATVELGQPAATAFTSDTFNNGGLSASSLYLAIAQMVGIAFDSSGNLWLSDLFNSRVLMYSKSSLTTNGAAATLELGHPASDAFTSSQPNEPTVGASGLYYPAGLAFDSSGNLYVGDSNNNRSLQFAPPFSNGMNATQVIGQANLASTNTALSVSGQHTPEGVTTLP